MTRCGRPSSAAGNVDRPDRRCGCSTPSALFLAIAIVLVAIGVDVAAQWTSFRAPSDRTILEGHWQSCRDEDGYAERVADLKPPGLPAVEFHMGPDHQFALFRGIQDEHRDHDADANLLRPYVVKQDGFQAEQRWRALGYQIHVVLAGGSRNECESWFVTVQRGRDE